MRQHRGRATSASVWEDETQRMCVGETFSSFLELGAEDTLFGTSLH